MEDLEKDGVRLPDNAFRELKEGEEYRPVMDPRKAYPEVNGWSVTRVVLSGFLFGNYFSIIYSLAGGLLSLTVMACLKKRGGFSVMGISVAGGVFHNVGQLVVAMLVVETYSVMYYLPVLLIAGLVTGFLIGLVSNEMIKRLVNIQM